MHQTSMAVTNLILTADDGVPHKACTFAGGGADGYGEPEQQGVVGVYLVCVGAKAAPGTHVDSYM